MSSDQFPQREQSAVTLGRARRLRHLARALESGAYGEVLTGDPEGYLEAAVRKYAQASRAFEDLGRARAARRCADKSRDCALVLTLLSGL